MNLNSQNKHLLSKEKERASINVLSANKISLYTDLVKSFAPKAHIQMTKYNYDLEALSKLFFKSTEPAEVTEEFNKTILRAGSEMISLQYGYVFYQNENGTGNVNLKKEEVTALCESYIKGAGSEFNGFVLDRYAPMEDGYYVGYRDNFKNFLIYSNYFEFYVTEKGIVQAELSYSVPVGFSGRKREICSADEALLTFMQSNRFNSKEVFINKMDIVYYQEENPLEEDLTINAVPCYRIYVENFNEPFLINAYLNNPVE